MTMEELMKTEEKTKNVDYELDEKGVRNLLKGIADQAISDCEKAYKLLRHGQHNIKIGGYYPADVIKECKEYFNTPQFKAIYGGIETKRIINMIQRFSIIKEQLEKIKDEDKRKERMEEIISLYA